MIRGVLGSRASIGGVLGSGRGGAAAAWYLAGGVSAANCVCAYQPKGAASLAASYTNLANPGTYTAVPGVAPNFNTATGWTFTGTQNVDAGYIPQSADTIIVRFANAVKLYIGMYQNASLNLAMSPLRGDGDNLRIYFHNTFRSFSPGYANCVMAMAGVNLYLNGAAESQSGVMSATNTVAFGFGRMNGSSIVYYQGDIVAAAIYNTTLSAAQVAAISTAMAAL